MAQDGFSKITVDIDLTEGQDVAKLQNYIKQFEQVIKNLTEDGKAFSSALRMGEKAVSKDFYVAKSRLPEATKGFEFVRSNVVGTGDIKRMNDPFQISKPADVSMESFRKLLSADRREVAAIKAQVMRLGGTMEPAKQQGYYDITMPNVAAETATGKPTTTRRLVEKKIRDANYESREAEKRAKLEEHKDNYTKFLEKEADKESKEENKMTDKMVSLFKKKPKDSDGKPTEEGEDKESGGSSQLSKLATLGKLYLIIKYIQIIADFAKKIFDAIGGLASQAKEDTKTGLTVGLSGLAVRNYAQSEVLKSLPSGTVTGALETIVQKFGVVSQLDQAALSKLALVLREDTAAVVQTGLGGEDPEQVMDLIVKDYLDRALSGVNAEGLQVGPQAAIRNLVAQLGTVSKDMANILATQYYEAMDKNDPTRSQAARGLTSEWLLQASSVINPTGRTNQDTLYLLEVNKTLKEIYTLWTGIRDGILLTIAVSLKDALGNLRNAMRIGMSKEQLFYDIEAAREDNRLKEKDAVVYEKTAKATETRLVSETQRKFPRGTSEASVREAATAAFAGNFPSDLGILKALNNNKDLWADLQGLGQVMASVTAAKEFIARLRTEIAKPDTEFVFGNVLTNTSVARGRARDIDLSPANIQRLRVSASHRGPGITDATRERDAYIANTLIPNYTKVTGTDRNVAAVGKIHEEYRRNEANKLDAAYASALAYAEYKTRETAAGRVPVPISSTTSSVTSKEGFVTVDIQLNGKSLYKYNTEGGISDTVVPIKVNMASLNAN